MAKEPIFDSECIECSVAKFVAQMEFDYKLRSPDRNCDRVLLTRYFGGLIQKSLVAADAVDRCSLKMSIPFEGHNNGRRTWYALPLIDFVIKECDIDRDAAIIGVHPLKD